MYSTQLSQPILPYIDMNINTDKDFDKGMDTDTDTEMDMEIHRFGNRISDIDKKLIRYT
jgi:hypothetical protein